MCKFLEGLYLSMRLFFVLMIVGCSESNQEQKQPAPAQEPNIVVQEQLNVDSYYSKDKGQWREHSAYRIGNEVEIGHLEGLNRLVLRAQHHGGGHDQTVYAYVNDDYTFTILVVFKSKCKPNTSIVTSVKFSNGEPKVLKCDSNGQSLVLEIIAKRGKSPDAKYEDLHGDLDGFYYGFDRFEDWEFNELIREITLNKAH